MRTISELVETQETNPAAVEFVRQTVTIEEDFYRWSRWLHDSETTTTVTVSLKRSQGRSLGIHPSSACKKDPCLLKIYYECTGEIEPKRSFDPKMQLVWDTGTLYHEMMQQFIKDMYGDQFESEVSLKDKTLRIKSHTDGIFDFTDVRVILEMKTIKEGGNFGWAKVQVKPFDDTVRQAHFYMKLADVPFALLLYINKNTSIGEPTQIKEHAVAFDPYLWDEIEQEVLQPVIAAAYGNGPMVRARPGWNCRMCDFQHACPSAEGGKKDGSRKHVW